MSHRTTDPARNAAGGRAKAAEGRPEIPVGRSQLGQQYAFLGAVCALVIGVYAWGVKPGMWEMSGLQVYDTYYNSLVQGFGAGQLALNREVPSRLAQLADP